MLSAPSSETCFQGPCLRGRSRCPRWSGKKLEGMWAGSGYSLSPESTSGIKRFPSPGRGRLLLSTHHLCVPAPPHRPSLEAWPTSREKARGPEAKARAWRRGGEFRTGHWGTCPQDLPTQFLELPPYTSRTAQPSGRHSALLSPPRGLPGSALQVHSTWQGNLCLPLPGSPLWETEVWLFLSFLL